MHKGYKCLHVPSNRVYISRDVIFDENVFPFSNLPSSESPSTSTHFPIAIDQFVYCTHVPSLLPNNNGAGAGRGFRLEDLEQSRSATSPASSSRIDPDDQTPMHAHGPHDVHVHGALDQHTTPSSHVPASPAPASTGPA